MRLITVFLFCIIFLKPTNRTVDRVGDGRRISCRTDRRCESSCEIANKRALLHLLLIHESGREGGGINVEQCRRDRRQSATASAQRRRGVGCRRGHQPVQVVDRGEVQWLGPIASPRQARAAAAVARAAARSTRAVDFRHGGHRVGARRGWRMAEQRRN